MLIPTLDRPMYEGLTTDEEKLNAMNTQIATLQKVNESDGMDFVQKTSQMVAYERHVESQRTDRLFNDTLAVHLYEPYGKRLSDAFAFGLTHAIFDPPGANIGLGLEGHVLYTAARTKLINDHIATWLNDDSVFDSSNKQVVNLGAGVDTRVYWLDCLTKASIYWEMDQASVMTYKQGVLNELAAKKQLPEPKCPVQSITIDFNKEFLTEMPAMAGLFDVKVPTCWILEGLIMYLPRTETERLLDDISELSATGSYMILNFALTDKAGPSIDEIDDRLARVGWQRVKRLMFGEPGFNFGRYPADKPTNKLLGFSMYQKEDSISLPG